MVQLRSTWGLLEPIVYQKSGISLDEKICLRSSHSLITTLFFWCHSRQFSSIYRVLYPRGLLLFLTTNVPTSRFSMISYTHFRGRPVIPRALPIKFKKLVRVNTPPLASGTSGPFRQINPEDHQRMGAFIVFEDIRVARKSRLGSSRIASSGYSGSENERWMVVQHLGPTYTCEG